MKRPTIFLILTLLTAASAYPPEEEVFRCGADFDGATCADGGFPGYCCSSFGYCGTTPAYCGEGCQNGCGSERYSEGNYNYCGLSWGHANAQCIQSCYVGIDAECPEGLKCYANADACPRVSPPAMPMSLRGADFDTQLMRDAVAIANEEQDNISDMGVTGTGSPWWIWIIIGVAVLSLIVCFIACRCHYKKKNKVAQEEDDDKNLDQPLLA